MLYDKLSFKVSPVFFDSLPEKEQIELIDKYSKAAQQGIKELNADGSGNTIVHDIIHLHSEKLFRVVFHENCPLLNTCNAEGSTPFLEAVIANDEALVIEMLNRNTTESINRPNHKGITPLLAAVDLANPKMVELLLTHGASPSVSLLDDRKMSPLHIAASLKDSFFVEILLKYGAKDLLTVIDSKGFTSFVRAIISGRVSNVRLMLKVKPELIKTLNQPDSFGVTPIQRVGRSGNAQMVNLLLLPLIKDQIKVDQEAFFTEEELESCLVQHSKDFLEMLSIDNVIFPLTIAQNYCSVMVALNDGKILRIPNADAEQVRAVLLEKKFGPEAAHQEGLNILTLYMSPGHGFLRLECRNCDEGKPYNMNRGFYGTGRVLPVGQTFSKHKEEPIQDIKAEKDSILSYVSNILPSKGSILKITLLGMVFFSPPMRRHAALSPGVLATKYIFSTNIVAGVISKCIDLVFAVSGTLREVTTLLPLGASIANHKRGAARTFRNQIYGNYVLLKEQIGNIGNEDEYEYDSDSRNSLKMTFYVNDEQAKAALATIKKVGGSCQDNPAEDCRYHFVEHNCVDFMQDVFESAGGTGDFASYLTEAQLSHGHVSKNFLRVNEFRAHNYAFGRSRGMSHYLKSKMDLNVNSLANAFLPLLGWEIESIVEVRPNAHFVDYESQENISSEKEPVSSKPLNLEKMVQSHAPLKSVAKLNLPMQAQKADVPPENASHAAAVDPVYLGDSLLLGLVLGKVAVNTYHFVTGLWSKVIGKKVTADEFSVWYEDQRNSLKISLQELDSFGEAIDEEMEWIDEEIDGIKNDSNLYSLEEKLLLDGLREEKSDLVKLRNQHIDLLFDAVKMEDELDLLKRCRRLPTKNHLENLQAKIGMLSSQTAQL